MKLLIKYFFSSISFTAITFIVIFYSSVHLDIDIFSNIVFYLYLVPLIVEISLFGQHYSVLKTANKKSIDSKSWMLEREKIILSFLICFLSSLIFVNDKRYFIVVFFIGAIFINLRMVSSFLRVKDVILPSIIIERMMQISISSLLLLYLAFNISSNMIPMILLLISFSYFAIVQFKFSSLNVFSMSSTKSRTDTRYELNMFLTIGSMLLVKSFDKIIVANYFNSIDFSKFVLLFQLYLPFPIVAGIAFQYFIPRLASKKNIDFKFKYIPLLLLFSLIVFYVASQAAYHVYDYVYKDKYNFNIEDIRLVIAAAIFYSLYQPIALVIVSVANNKTLFTLNILNILPISLYFFSIFYAISLGELKIILFGFLSFWIAKLFCGLYVVKKIDNFRWV